MIIALEEAKHTLTNFRADIEELGSALRIEDLRVEAAELEKKTLEPDFWNDQENSGKILRQTKQIKDKIERYERLEAKLEDAITLCELALEENDESMKDEILTEVAEITPAIEAMVGGAGSKLGTGGMATKLRAAKMVTAAGCDMIIANGSDPKILYDILSDASPTCRSFFA